MIPGFATAVAKTVAIITQRKSWTGMMKWFYPHPKWHHLYTHQSRQNDQHVCEGSVGWPMSSIGLVIRVRTTRSFYQFHFYCKMFILNLRFFKTTLSARKIYLIYYQHAIFNHAIFRCLSEHTLVTFTYVHDLSLFINKNKWNSNQSGTFILWFEAVTLLVNTGSKFESTKEVVVIQPIPLLPNNSQ